MSLWRSILNGFGARVGSDLAKQALDELRTDDEIKQAAKHKRNRNIAIAVVAISALGLLALSGALTVILKWLLGALFVAGLLGGAWFLGRKRWFVWKAARDAQKLEAQKKQLEQEKIAQEEAKLRAVQKQLEELKQRAGKS